MDLQAAAANIATMKLGYTIIYVADVLATVDFYERAFELERRFIAPGDSYAEMQTGETALGFAHDSMAEANGLTVRPNRAEETAAAIEIAFVTDDPAAAYARTLAAGAQAVKEPVAKPWGQLVGYVRDCNGVLVELCSPVG